MEETEAQYWATVAYRNLVLKDASASPFYDPRTFRPLIDARGSQVYPGIYRVDARGNKDPLAEVQVIELKGPLMEEDYCGSAGMVTIQNALKAAYKDESIKSIVLHHNSPGGSVAGTQHTVRTIQARNKPVVNYVRQNMASADYWIGSSGDEIIVDDEVGGFNSMIGSIGTKAVMMLRPEGDANAPKIISVYATKSTRKGKMEEDIRSGDFTRIQAELDQINEIFHTDVQKNRAGKLRLDLENVLEGDVYNGKDALKYGLADRFGSFEFAVKRSLQLAKTIKA